MITTLLVGFGFSAQTFHLPFLSQLPQYSVDVVVSSKPDEVKRLLPNAKVCPSLEDALENSQVDLVVITTPNHLHASQAKLALEYRCHVLVEKPFTLDSEQAANLVSFANQQQRHLCVFHNRRFDGDFLTLKYLIQSGRLGEIKRFESRFDRFRPIPRNRWRENAGPGSGIFWDLGPHLIDQALQLFGWPKAVAADILTLREGGQSDDTFDLTLYYDDKIIKLGSSAFQGVSTLRFDLQGTKASFRKFHLDPQEDQLRAGMPIDDVNWAVTDKNKHGVLSDGESEHEIETKKGEYVTFFESLASAIENNGPLPADASTVIPVIKLIELAVKSSAAKHIQYC